MNHPPSVEQTEIFTWFRSGERRHLVVRARAGTGKTTTILAGVDLAPDAQILLAAFNKSIATELQNRVNNPRVEAKTLHALGFKFIARNWKVKVDENGDRPLGLAKAASPSDIPDPMLKLVRELHTKAREINPWAVQSKMASVLVDLAIRFNIVPDDEWEEQGWDLMRVCECAHKAMFLAMEKTDVIDFADMIFLPLVHKWVRPWFDMVVIDEAQDMTDAQLDLAMGCCRRNGRICIVGDDRQAIYSFRGADSGSIDRLKAKLGARELSLTTTYRCAQLIVNLAKTLVPDYNAAPNAPQGEILNCDVDKMVQTAREGDFVLSRTNAPLIKICMALLKKGTRARIKGRDIGRGIIALIRKLGVRQITELQPKLEEHVTKETDRAQRLPEAAREERIQFLGDQRDIILALADGVATVAELETRCNELFADDAEKRAVMCSTVHRAKGLEADNTFLLEGTFFKGKDEEDNIRYVAITRAKTRMTWVKGFERAVAA